jgi:hypothetical protein
MAGAESPDFSAIIMLCDSVTVPYTRTNERHELSLSFRNGDFDGLIVPEPETYHFAGLIDGREISRASFRLVK